MSFVLLGILNAQAAGLAEPYFLSVFGGSGSELGNSVQVDVSKNVFVFGDTNSEGQGLRDFVLAKYNSQGELAFQKILGDTGNEFSKDLTLDPSDNLHLCGFSDSGGTNREGLLVKYDSSGNIQWQRILGYTEDVEFASVTTDSVGDVYVTGDIGASFSESFLLAKYNSSGALQWQRTLNGADRDFGSGIILDASDNLYVVGSTTSEGEGDRDALVTKYDSSGNLQWQRILGGVNAEFVQAVTIDSFNNLYACGWSQSEGAGSDDALLFKYNSSGDLQWQRILGGASGERANGISLDSLENVYIVGSTSSEGEGSADFLIAKYNSSGTIQWQRTLGGVSFDVGESITVDNSGTIYAFGRTQSTGEGSDDMLLAKLPNDGSLTGTYSLGGNNIVYAASTMTAATSTLTNSTSTLTSSTPSLTAATSTLTSGTSSLTATTEIIGEIE